MAEISLTAAFSSVPAPEQEAIKRLLTETIEQLAQEDRSFTRARVVFPESDERCGLSAELDGVKKEGVPLSIDIEQLEDAQTGAGARAQLKEALRLYFRRVMGKRSRAREPSTRGRCSFSTEAPSSRCPTACSRPRRARCCSAATSRCGPV